MPSSTSDRRHPGIMIEEQIRQLEIKRFRAMVSADLQTLGELLADEVILTHSNGQVDNKTQYMAALKDGTRRYISCERQQHSFRQFGEIVIVHGRMRSHIVLDSTDYQLDDLFSCVWLQGSAGWRLINAASTPMPPP